MKLPLPTKGPPKAYIIQNLIFVQNTSSLKILKIEQLISLSKINLNNLKLNSMHLWQVIDEFWLNIMTFEFKINFFQFAMQTRVRLKKWCFQKKNEVKIIQSLIEPILNLRPDLRRIFNSPFAENTPRFLSIIFFSEKHHFHKQNQTKHQPIWSSS